MNTLIADYLAEPYEAPRANADRVYKGDCGGKVWSRSLFYDLVRTAPRDGVGVFLTGPDATAEVEAIKSAGWPTDRLIGVDVLPSAGLFELPAIAPGAIARCADICTILAEVEHLSWFFGDFMGLSKPAVRSIEIACQRLLPDGIIGLTINRGREQGMNASAVAKAVGGVDPLVRGVAEMSGCQLDLVHDVDYHRRGGMAMRSLAWRVKEYSSKPSR